MRIWSSHITMKLPSSNFSTRVQGHTKPYVCDGAKSFVVRWCGARQDPHIILLDVEIDKV